MDAETKELLAEMAKKVAVAVSGSHNGFDEASKPFTTVEDKQEKERNKYILTPNKSELVNKKLTPFKTYTFMDKLFLDNNEEAIGGLPYGIQLGVTGLPASGKSILVEELAVKIASTGKHVLLITSEDAWSVESPRMDLQNRCKQKAEFLNLDWDKTEGNLFVIDAVTHTEMRDWYEFAKTYKFACEKNNIELVLFDSLTMLESYRGNLKYRLQEICKYDQLHGITAVFVNQRAKEEWDVREMAGGIGLGHILDATLIVDYGRTYHSQIRLDLDVKRGIDVRIIRVLGCRLCAFDGRYKQIEISSDGFLRLIEQTKEE